MGEEMIGKMQYLNRDKLFLGTQAAKKMLLLMQTI